MLRAGLRIQDGTRADTSPAALFAMRTLLKLVSGLVLGGVVVVPATIAGFRDAAPPPIQSRLDAFLPAIAAALFAATLAGSVVSSGGGLRHAPLGQRRRGACFVVLLSFLLGTCLYALVGWGLPLSAQRLAIPEPISTEQALQAHPFLLTTPELLHVQETFRAFGGFSLRVSLTLELRAWLAAAIPIFGLFSIVTVLSERLQSSIVRVLATQLAALVFWFAALVVTIGPALYLTPHPRPQIIAWSALVTLGVFGVWRLFRRLRSSHEVGSTLAR